MDTLPEIRVIIGTRMEILNPTVETIAEIDAATDRAAREKECVVAVSVHFADRHSNGSYQELPIPNVPPRIARIVATGLALKLR